MVPELPVDEVAEAARKTFGIPYLFPYQRLVIGNVIDSLDAHAEGVAEETVDLHDRQIVILPTGAGKSLCFHIPATLRPGITVVIFPLLSLMADQARRLEEGGWKPLLLSGGMDSAERNLLWKQAAHRPRSILITNPESTISPKVRRRLAALHVSHLVIDEAHCVTEWGESFRPAYRSLASLIEEINPAVVTAFTATASPRIIADLQTLLFPQGAHLIQGDPDRTNVSYSVIPTFSKRRTLRLLYGEAPNPATAARAPTGPTALREPPEALVPGPAPTDAATAHPSPDKEGVTLPVLTEATPAPRPSIVFCRSRAEAEQTAAYLATIMKPEKVRFYHAGLSKEEKSTIEGWFFNDDHGVLAATCAYGMGVDKKNIRSVVHLRPAPSVESYLQESGRGGRDGEAALAALLISPGDLVGVQEPEAHRQREYLLPLLKAPCRREALLAALGAANESCGGCDRCSRVEAPPAAPIAAFKRPRRWPALTGELLRCTLTGHWSPAVRETRAHLSPYWGLCDDWTPEELEELLEGVSLGGTLYPEEGAPFRVAIGRAHGGVGSRHR